MGRSWRFPSTSNDLPNAVKLPCELEDTMTVSFHQQRSPQCSETSLWAGRHHDGFVPPATISPMQWNFLVSWKTPWRFRSTSSDLPNAVNFLVDCWTVYNFPFNLINVTPIPGIYCQSLSTKGLSIIPYLISACHHDHFGSSCGTHVPSKLPAPSLIMGQLLHPSLVHL